MTQIELTGVGLVPAIRAEEILVGDENYFDYGGVAVVSEIKEHSPAYLWLYYKVEGKVPWPRKIRKNALVPTRRDGKWVTA